MAHHDDGRSESENRFSLDKVRVAPLHAAKLVHDLAIENWERLIREV